MKKDKRFETVSQESVSFSTSATILRDKETGVHYLFYAAGYAGGLTPLLGKDGKPIITGTVAE